MSIDLSTTWLGLKLDNPIVPGASPMSLFADNVKKLEDAGASAIVMPSLFEEQVVSEEMSMRDALDFSSGGSAEASDYLPDIGDYTLGPHEYLDHIRKLKEQTNLKIIASLNGSTSGGWIEYAEMIAEAGADALELNVYRVVIDHDDDAASVEQEVLAMVRNVKVETDLPLAVKLSPFYSSLPHLAKGLKEAGADGLVLFNRFFEPDLDPVELEMSRRLEPSMGNILGLRLRWLGILFGAHSPDLCVTGGVQNARDIIKCVQVGAASVQIVSALMMRGADHVSTLIRDLERWLEENEYESLMAMQGAMSRTRCPDSEAYTRANYVKLLQGWEEHWSPRL